VLGWQVMALKSGQMAGLVVSPAVMAGARQFLKSVASGYHDEQFAYLPRQNPSETMTSVGLLCSQYLGAKRNDPQITEGVTYLIDHLPDDQQRNIYYWYYAMQVMHNVDGPQWDTWNRKTRRILIQTQVKEGCAAGSWDPALPTRDLWGDRGGRLMVTSLSALTLEVYYRYLPLYKLDAEDETKPAGHPAAKPEAKPEAKPPADEANPPAPEAKPQAAETQPAAPEKGEDKNQK
jgi:hypothetical protein